MCLVHLVQVPGTESIDLTKNSELLERARVGVVDKLMDDHPVLNGLNVGFAKKLQESYQMQKGR